MCIKCWTGDVGVGFGKEEEKKISDFAAIFFVNSRLSVRQFDATIDGALSSVPD